MVSGRIYTDQGADRLRVFVEDERVDVAGEGGAAGFTFERTGVRLEEGANTVRVRVLSAGGDSQRTAGDHSTGGRFGAVVPGTRDHRVGTASPARSAAHRTWRVRGLVRSEDAAVELTVDGVPVTLVDASGRFETIVPLGGCGGERRTVELVATDSRGQSAVRAIELRCDNAAPEIALAAPADLVASAENRVLENPLPISGTVQDATLAGLSINGRDVSPTPSAEPDRYRFDVRLALVDGVPADLTLRAWDRAGNERTLDYRLLADLPVSVQVVSPADGARVAYTDAAVPLEVIARVSAGSMPITASPS